MKKIVYEIKPTDRMEILNEVQKIIAAKEWCKERQFTFQIINEQWYRDNIKVIRKKVMDENILNKLLKGIKMADTRLKIDDTELNMDQAYLRNKRLPRVDAEFGWTPKRIAELKKCNDSVKYFAENYFYITTLDDGKQKIDLYRPQKRVLRTLEKERFVIVCASRQCGKTTLMTIYALWLTCFNADKRVVIVANKEKTAIMILRRIKMAYEELPNWLKPGTAQWGNTEVIFGNDSGIAISTTTGSAVRGESVNCIGGDELITIRNKETSKIEDVKMSELLNRVKNNKKININLVE